MRESAHEAVALEDINVVESETLETGVDCREDVLARETVTVHVALLVRVLQLGRVRVGRVGDRHEALGQDDEFPAINRKPCQQEKVNLSWAQNVANMYPLTREGCRTCEWLLRRDVPSHRCCKRRRC